MMPDSTTSKVYGTSVEADLLVLVAAASVDPEGFRSFEDYDLKVAGQVARMKRLMKPNSLSRRVAEAMPLFVTIVDVQFEEASQRYVISARSEFNNDGYSDIETFRSDRVDGKYGSIVKGLWQDAVGKKGFIYKYKEDTGNSKKPTVRIAPYAILY